jgi:hypothetical protein
MWVESNFSSHNSSANAYMLLFLSVLGCFHGFWRSFPKTCILLLLFSFRRSSLVAFPMEAA